MKHGEVSKAVLGAAMRVLYVLRPGLSEKIYERALIHELRKAGHSVSQQKEFSVNYDGQRIGSLIPDLIVDDVLIADTKVVSAFDETHVAQMLGYLNITGLEVALLLNFKHARLEWKRVVTNQQNSAPPHPAEEPPPTTSTNPHTTPPNIL